MTGVGSTTIVATRAQESLVGQQLTGDVVDRAATLATEAAQPKSDHRGSAEFKRHIVHTFVARALTGGASEQAA